VPSLERRNKRTPAPSSATITRTTRPHTETETSRVGAMRAADLDHTSPPSEVLELHRTIGNQAVARLFAEAAQRDLIQRGNGKKKKPQEFKSVVTEGEMIGGVLVDKKSRGYPRWDMENRTWHLNTAYEPFHVTSEETPKQQYYFERRGNDCVGIRPESVGGQASRTSHLFNKLPKKVQKFVQDNYSELIR
jgi:hypothetical protein